MRFNLIYKHKRIVETVKLERDNGYKYFTCSLLDLNKDVQYHEDLPMSKKLIDLEYYDLLKKDKVFQFPQLLKELGIVFRKGKWLKLSDEGNKELDKKELFKLISKKNWLGIKPSDVFNDCWLKVDISNDKTVYTTFYHTKDCLSTILSKLGHYDFNTGKPLMTDTQWHKYLYSFSYQQGNRGDDLVPPSQYPLNDFDELFKLSNVFSKDIGTKGYKAITIVCDNK